MSEAGEEHWWLVASLPPSRPGTKGELDILREVTLDEFAAARRANALLNRLAQAAPYARLVELYAQLEAALARLGGKNPSSPKRVAIELNRSAVALGKVAADLPNEVMRHAREDFGVGSEELIAIEQAISEECGKAPFRLLVAVKKVERGGFAATAGGIANDTDAIAALQAEVEEVPSDIDLISMIGKGVLVGQRLIARQLQAYEERINEATLTLRRLAVEVLDGAPGLMLAKIDTSKGRIDMGPASFDPFPLDRSVTLLRALRHARFLLEATEESASGVESDPARAGSGSPPTARNGEPLAAERASAPDMPAPEAPGKAGPSREQEGPKEPADASAVVGGAAAEAASEPSGERADQVVDLGALAAHALQLTDELERAWSDALEPAALAAARPELEARFTSLLRTIERRASAGGRELSEAGIDTLLPAFPLPAAEYERISFEPDAQRHWLQLQFAVVDALMALLPALQAMRAPSGQSIELPSGQVETWWEAGAFDLIRSRAHALLRVIGAADAAEDALLGNEDASGRGRVLFDRLDLLRDALNRGDFEASLLHADRALCLRAELEGRPAPDDLLERLAGDQRLGEARVLLRLLDEGVARNREGRPLDPGAAAVIAAPAGQLVASLCLERPEIVRDALGLAAADSRPGEATAEEGTAAAGGPNEATEEATSGEADGS